MERFGPFEVGRVLDSGNGSVVYEARKDGDPKGRYVVKVFSPEAFLTDDQAEAKSDLGPIFQGLLEAFISRVQTQQRAAEVSRGFIPIVASGQDGGRAWYATVYYPRSVKGMLERFVALEPPAIYHVLLSVVRAARQLQSKSGRPHGNLKTANIFIEGTRRPRSSRVLLADPLPGEAGEAQRYEQADLRSIGELLYQFVMKKRVDFGWVIVPLESSPEWERLFGKKSRAWLELCNKLLDQNLSLDQVTLESVERELRKLEPKPPVPLVPTAIGVGVLGIAAVFLILFLQRRNTAVFVVNTDPPGSRVSIIALDQYGNEDPAHSFTNTTSMKGIWRGRLPKGRYKVKVEYHSAFGDLPSPHSVLMDFPPGRTLRTNFTLPFGGLVVRSEPEGAEFRIYGQTVQTPFTNFYLPPTNLPLHLSLTEYETTNFNRTIPSNHEVVRIATRLRKPPPGSALVEFASDPPGADIFVDGVKRGSAGDRVSIDVGAHDIAAELAPWFPRQNRQYQVQKGQNPVQSFYFPHGVLTVATSSPPVVELFLNGRLAGFSPTNLNLPPGPYTARFQAEGYETNRMELAIADRATNAPQVRLKPLAGFVFLSSDPPGAQVSGAGGQFLTNTVTGTATRLALPPGTNELTIAFTNLDPVWKTNVIVRSGRSNVLGVFRFRYGTVTFTNALPQELPANLTITGEGGRAVRFGEPIYQRPGASATYRVNLPDYDPWTVQLAVAEHARTNAPVRLERSKEPVRLESNLKGTRYSYRDERQQTYQLGMGTNFKLPWGTNELFARLSNLQPLEQQLVVPRAGGARASFRFKDYGLVITTNLTPGTEVLEREGALTNRLGRAPGPFYSRPGSVKFLLSSGGAPIEVSTNVTLAGWIVLAQPMPPITSPASGIEFYWVAGLPGTPSGGYVARTEVTQGEYDKVMHNDQSEPKGPELPVNNLDAKDAEAFCAQLNGLDKNTPWMSKGFHYALPTFEQWDYLTNACNPADAVFSPSTINPLKGPSPAGSKPADGNGLYDLYGNVWEICRGSGPGDYRIRGGCFANTALAVRILMSRAQDRFDRPTIYTGFRVVAVPSAQ